MRILQIIPHYVPAFRFGGPLRVAHSLGKSFITLGHHVTVCTTNMKDEKENLDVPLDKPINIDGINVYYEKVNKFKYWGYSPGLKNRINHEAKNQDNLYNK